MYSLIHYSATNKPTKHDNLTKEQAEELFKAIEEALQPGEQVLFFEGITYLFSATKR